MSLAETFIAELTQEAKTTRKVLERVPEEHLSWRPHPKSTTLGALAYHLAILPRAIADLLRNEETGVPQFTLPEGTPVAEVLSTLDASVPYAVDALRRWGDEGLAASWRMAHEGRTIMEMPRLAMVRNVMLNHSYHHRGQLTVYLRMLEVPLPVVYGPTADENPFAGS